MPHISYVYHWVLHTLSSTYHSGWERLRHLDRQQWMVLLAVTMVAGFLCMRGYGTRNR